MVKLFNIDLHVSVIADVTHILKNIFDTKITVTNCSISGHSWLFGKQMCNPDILNAYTWRNIGPETVNKFYERYKDELSEYDGFIVTHTPVFCTLYESFNKPIIVVNSCRYEQPFCWTKNFDLWVNFNSCLKRLEDKKMLFIISNNKGDKEYLLRGSGINSVLIPSLCEYTNVKAPDIPKNYFILYDNNNVSKELTIKNLIVKNSILTWEFLYSATAIIHLPYEISTMSIAEQYSSGVALIFPTKDFFRHLLESDNINISAYTHEYPSTLDLKEALAKPVYDFWLSKADFYDETNYKGCYYFNSFKELNEMCANFIDIYKEDRIKWIEKRKHDVYTKWKNIIENIFPKL